LLSRKAYYFAARRVDLILPREISERFTYYVRLSRVYPQPAGHVPELAHGGYVVQKEVPSVERVCARLRHKFPEAAEELIVRRARKFTEKIFPLFLTREAAMLKILERDLPIAYRDRVPRVISMEQDERGYVRRLWINWLRARTPRHQPLTQLEFARQSADLLRVMHDEANIIHLDLRLDNVVITDRGVGFVDFGSAVREGENIQGNPLLSTIFDELMRTSQIQKMLDRMMTEGKVTSHVLGNAYGKVDKGVDLFYLAVSINAPLINPDFQGLVTHDTQGEESAGLSMLTQDVLKPRDPSNPPIKSARDLLRSIEGLSFALRGKGLRRKIGEG
jgi:serine/threonine protein kinase